MHENKKLKYKYVVVGSSGYYDVAYHNIKNLDHIHYMSNLYHDVQSKLSRSIMRLTFSPKVNKYIRHPFKEYTFPKVIDCSLFENDNVCFLFFEYQYLYVSSDYLNYLRNKCKNAKIVLILNDIVASNSLFNIEKMKQDCDIILTYDQGDAKKYDLIYHTTPYSYIPIAENLSLKDSDFYFCGLAKTRYNTIFDIYYKLKSKGLKCDFHIYKLHKSKRLYDEGLVYDTPLTYIENLQHVKNTKCILEIMQEGADGFTPRLWESIMYDKHLLSNNTMLSSSPFFIENNIHNIASIDNVCEWINTPAKYNQNLKDSLSPENLLHFVDALL